MFEVITWLVTNKCNNACLNCNFRNRTREPSENERLQALEIFGRWPKSDQRFVCLLGGDIICMDGISSFARKLNELNLPYGFQTAATHYERMQEVLPIIRNLSISVDAFVDDEYRFRKMLTGIFWAGAKRFLNPDSDVHATITIDPWNIEKLSETIKILSQLGIWTELTFTHWKKGTFDLVPERSIALSLGEYLNGSIQRASIKMLDMKEQGYLIHSSADFIASWGRYAHDLSWQCNGPWNCVVDADLTMRVCLHLPGNRVRKWKLSDLADPISWTVFLDDWRLDQEELCPKCFWDCQYEVQMQGTQEGGYDWINHKR